MLAGLLSRRQSLTHWLGLMGRRGRSLRGLGFVRLDMNRRLLRGCALGVDGWATSWLWLSSGAVWGVPGARADVSVLAAEWKLRAGDDGGLTNNEIILRTPVGV